MSSKPKEMTIYNCHTHIFTAHSLPNNFAPFNIQKLTEYNWFREILYLLMKNVNPLSKSDFVERISRLLKASMQPDQCAVFNQLLSYYPENSAFVVLPMDMDFMGYGTMKQSIVEQHEGLLKILKDPEIGHRILPFVHFDPRRENAIGLMRHYLEQGFCGIKLYPNLGYFPDDEKLIPIWELANELHLPVTVHCSRGGVHQKDATKLQRWEWSKPTSYKKILLQYPNMKLCLGHFGGDSEWNGYLKNSDKTDNWLNSILDMMREQNEYGAYRFPNLYADISYSIFDFEHNVKVLKVLLTDPVVLEHTLFGSDFFLSEQEKFSEKLLSMYLRAELGESCYWQIANKNPICFLKHASNN